MCTISVTVSNPTIAIKPAAKYQYKTTAASWGADLDWANVVTPLSLTGLAADNYNLRVKVQSTDALGGVWSDYELSTFQIFDDQLCP